MPCAATSNARLGRFEGLLWMNAAFGQSLGCHQHNQRHFDELFVFADCLQRSAHVASNLTGTTLLDPQRELHDGSPRASWF
jgi:hypothetical protein